MSVTESLRLAGMPVRPSARQMTLDLGVRQAPGLADSLPGANAECLAWLQSWGAGDALAAQQAWGGALGAYVQGDTGVGKTHLLQAVLGEVVARGWGGISLGATQCRSEEHRLNSSH